METPILLDPEDGASFWHDEFIPFRWQLAEMHAEIERFDLYISTDRTQPLDAVQLKVMKSWDIRPGAYWSSLSETADRLGLAPHETYYWLVAQEYHTLPPAPPHPPRFSTVRAIQIKGQRLQGKLQFGLQLPTLVAQGTPVKIVIGLENTTYDPIHLFFPTVHHFEVAISRSHLLGRDEHIWPLPVISAQVIDVVKISPHQTYKEVVIWPQVDIHDRPVDVGPYSVRVHCNANDFQVEGKGEVDIIG